MTRFPFVALGAPIHNRDRVVSLYLEALSQVDYPPEKLLFLFLANNCDDPTIGLLRNFQKDHNTNIIVFDDVSSTTRRNGARYHPLSTLRNKLLDKVSNTPCEYFLSVDSDLIIPPESIKRLLSHRKDAVSGLVYNDLHIGGRRNVREGHVCNILSWAGRKDKAGYPAAGHIRKYPDDELIPVDITGAFVLMSRPVVENVRYNFHSQGEDLAWSIELQKQGYQAWCDTGLRPIHLMTEHETEVYIASRKVPI